MSMEDLKRYRESLKNEVFRNAVKYCNDCKHRILTPGNTCPAFPSGIPLEVLIGKMECGMFDKEERK
jgi:hypothetical protein